MGETMKKLGWYSRIEIKREYSIERVFETIDKAISDFEREKDTLLKKQYRRITYYCPKCYWFLIDLPREYGIDSDCPICSSKLEYVNREFLEEYSKLLREYSVRVKALIKELFKLFGKCNGFQITSYSEIWLVFENEFTKYVEIALYPIRYNSKNTIYSIIELSELNTSRLDIVDEIERIIDEYGIIGKIQLLHLDTLVEDLFIKGYNESYYPWRDRGKYDYINEIISKYLV
jgi:hypothetical protein